MEGLSASKVLAAAAKLKVEAAVATFTRAQEQARRHGGEH
jgi:hypothetical protein